MTVSAALAPFALPHKGQCLCAECPWGKWCNYCIMQMVRGPDALIFINRERPALPLFLSRDEAVTIAQGLAQSLVPGKDFGGNRFKAALIECMKSFAESWGVKQALPPSPSLSECLQSGIQAIRDCSGVNLELLGMQFGQTAPAAKFVPCIKDFVMGEGGDPTAWPEPDTHDEWRKLNGE